MTELLVRVGRWMISLAFVAFPRPFRETHRADALAYFEDRAREVGRRRGAAALLVHVLASLASTVVSGLAERVQAVFRVVAGGGGVRADVRYGLRSLRRHPGFVIAAVIPLGVGIAAVTSVFAVVDHVLLRPLPYDDPDALVEIGRPLKSGRLAPVSTANAIDVEGRLPAFEAVGGVTGGSTVVQEEDAATQVRISRPTRDFMNVFRLRPALGRGFTEEDFHHPAVALVTWSYWQARWGADPGALGAVLDTGLGELRVVGVLPRDWSPPEALSSGADGALWVPTDYDGGMLETTRAFGFTYAAGRLRPDASMAVANAQLRGAAASLAEGYPDKNHERDGSPKMLEARSLRTQTVGEVQTRLLLLLGTVGALLAIACANVANLFLARGTQREREFAMRTVMGAGRRRLSVQLLTESVAVALLGGAVGVTLARLFSRALVALTPALPRADSVAVDVRVAAAAAAVSMLCGVGFGLLPAWTVSQRDPGRVLRGGRQRRRGGDRLRSALVVGQTALALVLVVGGGLLLNTAVRLSLVDPGMDAEGVLTFRPHLPSRVSALPFHLAVAEKVANLPGVTSVTGGIFVPGEGLPVSVRVRREDGEELSRWRHTVLPGLFETLRIPILAGRPLSAQDRAGGRRVAVVSETLAKELWPGVSPVGLTLPVEDGEKPLTYVVVGVAADVRDEGPRHPPEGVIYESFLQHPWLPSVGMLVRHDGDARGLPTAIRQAVHEVDPSVPVSDIRPLADLLGQHTEEERDWAVLLGVFSLAALVIAAMGVYATMSYTVARRIREMGIRRAVGARRGHVVGLVLGRGLLLTTVGVVIGTGLALAATRVLSGILFEITTSDPATYVVVAVVLLGAALVACALPAVRATRADPLAVLREE